MNTKTVIRQEVVCGACVVMPARFRLAGFTRVGGVACLALVVAMGCTPEKKDIPPIEVKTVEAYGMKLDESATPQQVAFVLLTSLADDVQAAQAHKRDEQKAANNVAFSLAAFDVIEQRVLGTLNLERPEGKKLSSLGERKGEKIFNVVNYWAPIVAYYVRSFDADAETAIKKMRIVMSSDQRTAHVYYAVSHEPVSHEAAAMEPVVGETAIIDIELALTRGTASVGTATATTGAASLAEAGAAPGAEYWRVAHVGFAPKPVQVQPHPTTQPVSASVLGK